MNYTQRRRLYALCWPFRRLMAIWLYKRILKRIDRLERELFPQWFPRVGPTPPDTPDTGKSDSWRLAGKQMRLGSYGQPHASKSKPVAVTTGDWFETEIKSHAANGRCPTCGTEGLQGYIHTNVYSRPFEVNVLAQCDRCHHCETTWLRKEDVWYNQQHALKAWADAIGANERGSRVAPPRDPSLLSTR